MPMWNGSSYIDDPVDEIDEILAEQGLPRMSSAERYYAKLLVDGHRVKVSESGGVETIDITLAP